MRQRLRRWRRRVNDVLGRRPARVAESARRYRFVFVVTYGRSGSTLLQGLLNSRPGYLIRGENYNVLYRLYQADEALTRAYTEHRGHGDRPSDAWFGIGRAQPDRFRAALVDNFVTHVLRPGPEDRVLGFKEIRYTPVHQEDLAEFLAFLRRAFPGCRIIFNHRDPDSVAASAWWVNVDHAADQIRAADQRFYQFPDDEQHFHYRYDELDDRLDNVRALMRFLGEPFDEAAVRAVLARPHGPFTKA